MKRRFNSLEYFCYLLKVHYIDGFYYPCTVFKFRNLFSILFGLQKEKFVITPDNSLHFLGKNGRTAFNGFGDLLALPKKFADKYDKKIVSIFNANYLVLVQWDTSYKEKNGSSYFTFTLQAV